MPLTFQEVLKEGMFDALVELYNIEGNCHMLLTEAGFPNPRSFGFSNAQNYWQAVCGEIENGRMNGRFEALFQAVARHYPFHRVFGRFRPENSPPPGRDCGISAMFEGDVDRDFILRTAREMAPRHGLAADSISLGDDREGVVILEFSAGNRGQALDLVGSISNACREANRNIQATLSSEGYRDFLITRINMVGPDQARFEVTNVPSSTLLRILAQRLLNDEYDPSLFGAKGGMGRAVTVDKIDENGSMHRMEGDKTLQENNIRTGDTIHIHPQSTAGSVNPVTRELALSKARSQIYSFAESHPEVQFNANDTNMPTEYEMVFTARSFAPPMVQGGAPVPETDHKVYLWLPPDFPMVAPRPYWQTPIFHPNIHPEDGWVCLGELGDHYRPGLDFGALCQIFIDIAGYQNYAAHSGLNLEAQKWAISLEGQRAIESIGGKSLIRMLVNAYADNLADDAKFPFEIKRIRK